MILDFLYFEYKRLNKVKKVNTPQGHVKKYNKS